MDEVNRNGAVSSGLAPLRGWAYPVSLIKGEVADMQTYMSALSHAGEGFYPLGTNGLWHGGIHFNESTGQYFDQKKGVHAIADGEVVAYKINKANEKLKYPNGKVALYSSGFVLIRHHLALPSAPKSVTTGQKMDGDDKQPADEVLEFFTLYMHTACWYDYEDDASLARPAYWLSTPTFIVGHADHQETPPHLHKSIAPVVSKTTTKAAPVNPVRGAHIRIRPTPIGRHGHRSGKVVGLLPESSCVQTDPHNVVGRGKQIWAKITKIVSGAPVAAEIGGVAPDIDEIEKDGWIFVAEQKAVTEPDNLDSTVILPKPFPIGAGQLVAHLGEYQHYGDACPLPHRKILHLEVFAGEQFKVFFEKSRKRAGQLSNPEMRLLPKGSKLIKEPEEPDTSVADGLVLKPLTTKEGTWVKAQPCTVHGKHELIPAKNTDPLWVRTRDLGQTKDVKGWAEFPLQGVAALSATTMFDRVYTGSQVSRFGHAVDGEGKHWYEVGSLLGSDKQAISGWVSDDQWIKVGPFAWPGFEIIEATGFTPKDAFQRQCIQEGELFPGEAVKFKPAATVVNNNPLMVKLEQVMMIDKSGTLDTRQLGGGLRLADVAQGLAHIIGKYESEWGGPMSKWGDLAPLMGNAEGQQRWQVEMERIGHLQVWPQLAGVPGFPAPTAYHFHPIGLVANFMTVDPVDLLYLAKTLYGEARGQNYQSKLAVAWIIRNRVASGIWGSSYRSVVTAPYQFTCWSKTIDPGNYAAIQDPSGRAWEDCKRAAEEVLMADEAESLLPGAINYYSPRAQAALHASDPDQYPATPPFAIPSKSVPNPDGVSDEDYLFFKP